LGHQDNCGSCGLISTTNYWVRFKVLSDGTFICKKKCGKLNKNFILMNYDLRKKILIFINFSGSLKMKDNNNSKD